MDVCPACTKTQKNGDCKHEEESFFEAYCARLAQVRGVRNLLEAGALSFASFKDEELNKRREEITKHAVVWAPLRERSETPDDGYAGPQRFCTGPGTGYRVVFDL